MDDIKCLIHNEFEFVVTDSRTGKEKTRAKAFNIILNNFWNTFISGNTASCFANIAFGSGTATPVITDTTLTARMGSKAMTGTSRDWTTLTTDGIVKTRGSIRLEDTEFQNTTISEVGLSTNGTNMVTKSLLKDQNGNVLSIPKGEYDIVDIYATFFSKFPIAMPGVSFSEGTYAFPGLMTLQSNIGWYGVDFGAKYHRSSYSLTPTIAYDAPNKKITMNIPNMIASAGNFTGGINMMTYRDWLSIIIPRTGFTQPQLQKEVIGIGDGVKKDFNPAFYNVSDWSGAKLYVDDVEVAATFDTPPFPPAKYVQSYLVRKASDIWENIYNDILKFDVTRGDLYSSDDGITWSLAFSYPPYTSGDYPIPVGHQRKRFFKCGSEYIGSTTNETVRLIHAAVPPPVGSTITLTYTPNCIAKDANHVLHNMSIAFTFGEYIPS